MFLVQNGMPSFSPAINNTVGKLMVGTFVIQEVLIMRAMFTFLQSGRNLKKGHLGCMNCTGSLILIKYLLLSNEIQIVLLANE